MSKVCVLLSYYNGNRYLNEQLISICEQTFSGEITILIRDDGSDDPPKFDLNTKEYSGPRKTEVYRGDNIGPQKSFLDLIQKASDADHYFFSDQDDVWLPDKVESAVNALAKYETPALWCCNYSVTDENLNVLRDGAVRIVDKTFHFLYAQMYNTFPGCVMGMNKALMEILKNMDLTNCMMHDSFAFATAAALGEVYYDDKSYVLHRIHDNNVLGDGFHKSTPVQWIREKTALLVHKEPYDLSEFAEKLLEQDGIKSEYIEDIRLLAQFKDSIRNTLKLFRHPDLVRKIDPEVLSRRCKVLFRLF